MNQITDQIWIGDSQDAAKPTGLDAVLNCAVDLQDKQGWDQGVTLAHSGLTDGPGNHLAVYYSAVLLLASLVQSGKKVLVHCHAGQSRSVSVVIMYLHTLEPLGWDHWRSFVAARREMPPYAPHASHRAAFDSMDFGFIRSVIEP